MARGTRSLALAGLGFVAAALAAAAPGPEAVLEIENTSRGRTVRLAVRPGESFSVTYQHSMYDQPVTEDFMLGEDGTIVLRSVSSPSAAVLEYFGITAAGVSHPVRRTLREIVFRVAAGAPQMLRAGGVERSFLELGEHGDRLVMRVRR
jgi:hypothetical protein